MSKHKLLSIESATHTLTVLFGLTSLANVNAFLRNAGHDHIAAVALSVALGAALIVVSIALTRIDWQAEKQTFYALVAVGLALGVISGALQSSTYASHLDGLWPYLLGYGVPLVGEIGLSLASALFSRAQRRSELRAVNAKIEQAIVTNLDAAINSFDPSTIQRRIDKTLNRVALAAVGGVESDLMAVYGQATEPQPDKGEGAGEDITPFVQQTGGDLGVASSVKMSRVQERMDRAFALIQCGDRSLSAIADEVGVSEKTITRYIDQFREQGHTVTVNGVCKVGA